jgi:hypothetical protein
LTTGCAKQLHMPELNYSADRSLIRGCPVVAQLWPNQSNLTQTRVSASECKALIPIRRLAPRLPEACRQGLSDQADAIFETRSALVALDRRNLEAAWHRANTALAALPRPSSGSVRTRE